jgi:hypothetical protein
MTIYMVEHLFARPEWEVEWNAWYEGNLKVLLGVPGFRSGQRFRSAAVEPRYMAMYTVDSPAVFDSAVYKAAGGGGANSQRFREAYQIWIRNLFDSTQPIPNVEQQEYLLVEDTVDASMPLKPGVQRMTCSGFHKTTPYRCLSVLQAPPQALPANALCYRAITAQQGPLYKD